MQKKDHDLSSSSSDDEIPEDQEDQQMIDECEEVNDNF